MLFYYYYGGGGWLSSTFNQMAKDNVGKKNKLNKSIFSSTNKRQTNNLSGEAGLMLAYLQFIVLGPQGMEVNGSKLCPLTRPHNAL